MFLTSVLRKVLLLPSHSSCWFTGLSANNLTLHLIVAGQCSVSVYNDARQTIPKCSHPYEYMGKQIPLMLLKSQMLLGKQEMILTE